MSSPIALVLGAGANIGQAVGRKFTANGYKVALASRTASSEVTSQDAKDGLFYFRVDLTNPENVKTLFEQVHASLGVPNVVIYNGLFYPHPTCVFTNEPEGWISTILCSMLTFEPSIPLKPAIMSADQTPSQSHRKPTKKPST